MNGLHLLPFILIGVGVIVYLILSSPDAPPAGADPHPDETQTLPRMARALGFFRRPGVGVPARSSWVEFTIGVEDLTADDCELTFYRRWRTTEPSHEWEPWHVVGAVRLSRAERFAFFEAWRGGRVTA